MLERRTTSQGPVFYVSPLLERIGVAHAFSTRIGGVSAAPFDSLNLGNPNGCEIQDDVEQIAENYRRLQAAIGRDDQPRLRLHQVHGGVVIRAMKGEAFENDTRGDGLISDDPHRVLSIRVADCAPVLLAGRDGAIVAAIHAGWRGVIAEVVPNALRALVESGCAPDSIVAAIGPCIGEESFEVGPEVVDQFERAFGVDTVSRRTPDGKGRVDLRRAIAMQLEGGGVAAERIDSTDRCTYRDRDEFFSHRRDNGITGRMAALIAARK